MAAGQRDGSAAGLFFDIRFILMLMLLFYACPMNCSRFQPVCVSSTLKCARNSDATGCVTACTVGGSGCV